jgi:hypothetical protein
MTEEVNPDQEEEVQAVTKFADKLIQLDTGALLLGRVIVNHDQRERFVYVFKPVEINIDEIGNAHMHPWVPESHDTFYYIPTTKVINVCSPRKEFVQAYHSMFLAEKPQGVKPVPDPETAETSEGQILH